MKPLMIDKEGFLHVPNTPGLGAEIDFEAVKRFTI
jgi:L-alanine-DL-glutamate epimerase-like enolase superfamily enzyme